MTETEGKVPSPLVYEETPILSPVSEPKKEKKRGFLGAIVSSSILFIFLFVLGVLSSLFLRNFFSPEQPTSQQSTQAPQRPKQTPTPLLTQPADPFASWKSYQVTSGSSKQVLPVLYKLPSDVIAPICDGPLCASSGTYLPGGTRLTIAPRGTGQLLPTTEGAIITDAGGREFVMKQASVSAGLAQEFTGLFTGTTGGGYSFSQIRGIVVRGSNGLFLEMNHFTPTGVNADWNKDDSLFDAIVGTIRFGE